MLEIKDEDRIIGRICRGELRFLSQDIEDLVEGKLDEAEEQDLKNIVEVVNKTIDRNQKIRNEMKEKVAAVEKDNFVKETLEKIDIKIQELQNEYDQKRFTPSWKIILGTLLTLILGMGFPMFALIFSSSLWVLGTATFVGFFTGVGIDLGLIVKSQSKLEEIKKQIKEFEKSRLEIVEDGIDETKTQENEIKMNIVSNIYEEREVDKISKNVFSNDL